MNTRLLIWILQTGEPLPSDDGSHRPMRAINLANALTSAGHNVVLWSASFNHQTKTHRCNGYKSIQYSENLEIRLIPSPGYKKYIGLGRLFDHMVLAKNLKKLLKQEKVEPNVAFIGYPPIEAASIMTHWLIKRNTPCLLDIKDQWPSFMVDALPRGFQSIGRAILSPYFYLAKRAMKEATGLSAMADDFLKWALDFSNRERTNNDLTVPLTTENCQISDDERKSAVQWWEKQGVVNNGKMKVMFVGSHYPSLDFAPILEAAALFCDKGIECDFIICGHGELTESLVNKAKNCKNVFFPGWVDRPKVEELSKMSIASIAPFRNIDCFMKSLPNKVIDSLSLGLPIISPLKGEVRRLIETNKVGLIYDEGSGRSLFNCIVELGQNEKVCNKITTNSIKLYNSRFSYEIVYGGLVKHIESLAMIKANDKNVERSRYDDRALKLLSNDSFDKDNGSSSYPHSFRAPYLRYEEAHIEFINNNDNVLEIGAGTGAHTHSLLKTGAFVVATDISPNSVQIIKKKYKEYSDKLITKVSDMESLPFSNEIFDVVCSAGSLSYGDNQVVMNEINRVLKPGGKVIIVDSLHEHPLYIINRWIGYFRGARSLSTIKRMPTLKLIEQYQNNFELVRLKFFGSLIWMSPLLKLIIGVSNTAIFIDKFDNAINVRRSAFKFVMTLRKK